MQFHKYNEVKIFLRYVLALPCVPASLRAKQAGRLASEATAGQ
jgi:hypothetical protein